MSIPIDEMEPMLRTRWLFHTKNGFLMICVAREPNTIHIGSLALKSWIVRL